MGKTLGACGLPVLAMLLSIIGTTLPVAAAPLDQADLAREERVVRHLRGGMTEEDRRLAAMFYLAGEVIRQRHGGKNWGALVKAYGDSAVHRPAPPALKAYAEASLRSWREWSNPQPDLAGAKRAALRQAQGIYAAALAADDVVRELTPEERVEIAVWRDCIGAWLDTGRRGADCTPLEWIAAP